jgi:glycerol-3-phosphate acyltransferase PlsY
MRQGLVIWVAYWFGSIPFSLWVAKVRGVDVRAVGSGNVGATNVMRSAGKGLGLLAFGLDCAKGAGAAWLGGWASSHEALPAAAVLAAVIGHVYPVWLRGKGGKGVATGVGGLIVVSPWAGLAGLATFTLVAALTRYVSLGSILGALALGLAMPLLGARADVSVITALIVAVIIWRHRENILRLRLGTERRFGERVAHCPPEPPLGAE